MVTTHQFIQKYPISKKSKKLIVGTIHPHNHENFTIPFFYGNVMSIWNILSDAFPTDLKRPISLDGILKFLESQKISISDTIVRCERKNPTALDRDLIPIELNKQLVEEIRKSDITEILFTSGFGKNNAFRLFYVDILGLKLTSDIKANRGVILDKEIFGRPIKLIILYSPSGTSNVGLSKSSIYQENKIHYKDFEKPVYKFKVDYYREIFSDKIKK